MSVKNKRRGDAAIAKDVLALTKFEQAQQAAMARAINDERSSDDATDVVIAMAMLSKEENFRRTGTLQAETTDEQVAHVVSLFRTVAAHMGKQAGLHGEDGISSARNIIAAGFALPQLAWRRGRIEDGIGFKLCLPEELR